MGLLEERVAVVRLAELWYQAEGFISTIPTGLLTEPAPWIEDALTEKHEGDCTKVPAPCRRCHAEDQMQIAEWVYPRLRARHALALSKASEG